MLAGFETEGKDSVCPALCSGHARWSGLSPIALVSRIEKKGKMDYEGSDIQRHSRQPSSTS